jgi:hypothetical protein
VSCTSECLQNISAFVEYKYNVTSGLTSSLGVNIYGPIDVGVPLPATAVFSGYLVPEYYSEHEPVNLLTIRLDHDSPDLLQVNRRWNETINRHTFSVRIGNDGLTEFYQVDAGNTDLSGNITVVISFSNTTKTASVYVNEMEVMVGIPLHDTTSIEAAYMGVYSVRELLFRSFAVYYGVESISQLHGASFSPPSPPATTTPPSPPPPGPPLPPVRDDSRPIIIAAASVVGILAVIRIISILTRTQEEWRA